MAEPQRNFLLLLRDDRPIAQQLRAPRLERDAGWLRGAVPETFPTGQ